MSTPKDKFPRPGDEVAYVQYDRVKMPGIAWIYFTNGNFVEFPVWEDDRNPETGLVPVIDTDPTIPKKEQ